MAEIKYAPTARSDMYRSAFSAPNGKAVLDDLREQFYDCPIKGQDATQLFVAVGERAVVRYILDMIEGADHG